MGHFLEKDNLQQSALAYTVLVGFILAIIELNWLALQSRYLLHQLIDL